MNYELYDDKQLVAGILDNDKQVIEYFFMKKCEKMFAYILFNVFDNAVSKYELIGELYLFMAEDNWKVLRNFHYRSRLMTYVSVVAIRFFQKNRKTMIDSASFVPLNDKRACMKATNGPDDSHIDVRAAILRMPNARYRHVIEKLDLMGWKPDEVASDMGVTVDNLYNIHRRAIMQLRLHMNV